MNEERWNLPSIRRWSLAAAVFMAGTVLFTWPLVLHMGDSVVGQYGDNLQFVWLIGWFQQSILNLHMLPFHVPILNYPEGWDLARSEITPIQILMGLPISELSGPVLAYNVVLLLTFFLSGLTAYAWIHKLTGSSWAGLIGGGAFAFSPFRLAHFRAGHLNVEGTMWFPLYFMALFDLVASERPSRGSPALAGLSLGLISLTSQYAFYMTVVLSILVVGVYLLVVDRDRLKSGAFWLRAGKSVAWSAPLALAGVAPYLSLSLGSSLPGRTIGSVMAGSAGLSDFLLPSTDHFLWGGWIATHFARDHWIEGTLYLGAVVFALGLVGFWRGLSNPKLRRTTLMLGLLFAASVALAMGTHLYWNEQVVRVAIPGPLQGWLGRASTAIPLPGYFMFKYVPFYDNMRTFKRTGIFAILALSILAGLGLWQILRARRPKWHVLIGIAAALLIFLDFYPGPFTQFAQVKPRSVDLWLASQPGDGAVAIFPFSMEEDQIQVYYTLVNHKPFLGGFFNAYPPRQYRKLQPVMAGFPDQASITALAGLGVEYVLVSNAAYQDPGEVLRQAQDLGLRRIGEFGGVSVLSLDHPGPSTSVDLSAVPGAKPTSLRRIH